MRPSSESSPVRSSVEGPRPVTPIGVITMTTTAPETDLLGVVLTPRQIWELLDLVNDAEGDADEDVLDAVAGKLRAPRVFTRVSAARYQGRLLALEPDEHEALLALVEDDVTPSDAVIESVSAALIALVPDRGRGSGRPNKG